MSFLFFFFVVLSSLFCCFSPAIIDISIGRETCDSKKKGKRNAAKRTEHKKGQKKGKKKRHFVTCVFSSCSLGADIVITFFTSLEESPDDDDENFGNA